jgi:lysophospholipase L1-like esterase
VKSLLIPLAGASLTLMTLAGFGSGSTHANDQPAVKIVLVGDSTVATGGGWGPGFCAAMTPNVACVDDALNGRSSKSFIAEGAWTKALAEKGNYYLIQFGHNDMKGKGADRETDPNTTFAENLRKYIADARAIGAQAVLVTSLSRRTYKDGAVVEDLKDYAESTRKAGLEEHVSVIDLNAISTTMLNHMTQAEADRFNAVDQEKERLAVGKTATDRTHLNAMGQKTFGRIVAEQLAEKQPELRKYILSAATESR